MYEPMTSTTSLAARIRSRVAEENKPAIGTNDEKHGRCRGGDCQGGVWRIETEEPQGFGLRQSSGALDARFEANEKRQSSCAAQNADAWFGGAVQSLKGIDIPSA